MLPIGRAEMDFSPPQLADSQAQNQKVAKTPPKRAENAALRRCGIWCARANVVPLQRKPLTIDR